LAAESLAAIGRRRRQLIGEFRSDFDAEMRVVVVVDGNGNDGMQCFA
jgi:very-short-patch-repair endonuclease